MNLLVTGAWNHAQDHLEQIRQMGHDVRFLQYEKDDLPCTYDWVEGVICNGLFCHHSIEKFTRLRYIQLTSAGYDRVPMAYIREKGISVFNARGVYSIPMAEWAVMSILEIYKNAYGFYRKQQQKNWEKDRSLLELAGKRAAIIGYGSVGRETAKRLAVFDVEITAVNRSRIEDDRIRNWIPLNRIDEALKQADIVILCIALTEETRNLLNADRLHGMKQGSVLVNMARGALLDEKELVGGGRRRDLHLSHRAQHDVVQEIDPRRKKVLQGNGNGDQHQGAEKGPVPQGFQGSHPNTPLQKMHSSKRQTAFIIAQTASPLQFQRKNGSFSRLFPIKSRKEGWKFCEKIGTMET